MGTKALLEERAVLAKTITDLNDTVEAEKREYTPEEQRQWDEANDAFEAMTGRLDKAKRSDHLASIMEAPAAKPPAGESRQTTPGREATVPDAATTGLKLDESRDSFYQKMIARIERSESEAGKRAVIRLGSRDSDEYRNAFGRRMTPEYNSGFSEFVRGEKRALQVDLDTQGGFTVVSEQFMAMLIQAVDDVVFMRGISTVLPLTSAESLGVPSLETDISDPIWTAEIQTGSEDSDMAFGKRALTPHPVAKRIKVSDTLIRKSAIAIEQLIAERLAHKFGVVEENAFLTGSGANQPLGVFTASASGISTARDIVGGTTTKVTADGLVDAFYNLKPQYMGTATWMFNRTVVRDIRKLKDGEGQYLWQPGLTAGQPDLILGRPFLMSEFAPNTMTTGLYVGMIADWRFYWIADALDMRVQRLSELYAETNQVGFIGRKETDGMPVLEEAFSRIALA